MDVTLCSIVAGSSTSPGDDDGAFNPLYRGDPGLGRDIETVGGYRYRVLLQAPS